MALRNTSSGNINRINKVDSKYIYTYPCRICWIGIFSHIWLILHSWRF